MKRALLLLSLAALPAAAQGAPGEPVFRLETGMHTAPVTGLAADAAGRFLATGSLDGTVRVWGLPGGDLLRTLRPRIGPGHPGKIHAVAISSDGAVIAAGGSLAAAGEGEPVLLFDRESGRLLRRLQGPPGSIQALAFSRDGARLAARFENTGLRLFRVSDGSEIAQAADGGGSGHGLDFDAAGRLAAGSSDGFVRLLDPELKPLASVRIAGATPHRVRFSPDGRKVAVGFSDATRVDVLSGTDLKLLSRPNLRRSGGGAPGSVAWTADGRWLYAAGGRHIHRWDDAGKGSWSVSMNQEERTEGRIVDLAPLPGGRIAYATTRPSWGVRSASGEALSSVTAPVADFSAKNRLRLSADGSSILFSYTHYVHGEQLASFSVHGRDLQLDVPESPRFSYPLISPLTSSRRPRLKVTGWTGFKPEVNGRPLGLPSDEESLGLALARDDESFLLGSRRGLYSFDARGRLRWKVSADGPVFAVNLSADGRLAVAALGDGTVRWFRADDGAPLLTFFPHADRRRWVAWTPTGYYDASAGGEELIGWQVDRGAEEAAELLPEASFRERFYRPDVVALVLTTLDEARALAEAGSEAPRLAGSGAARILPPVVTLLSPGEEIETTEPSVTVRVAVRSPSGEPVTAIRAYVDGRPVATRGLVLEPASPPSGQTYSLSVPVPPRDCIVTLAAETRLAASEPVPVRVRRTAAASASAPGAAPRKPALYLLAVGVGDYANPAFRLDFPAKDARDVAAAWQRQEGGLYGRVEARVITDRAATKDAILSGLEWLESRTTQDDVALLFFAGHGINDPRTGEYLFLPHEADLAARRVTLLPHREVVSALSALPGKVLVFLDTCHSGNLLGGRTRDVSDLTRLLDEMAAAEPGLVVFSATTGRGLAQETAGWENGAFTRALLEALEGRADQDGDRSLWIAEIETYLGRRVRELTRGLQTPATAKPRSLPDFPVAVVDRP